LERIPENQLETGKQKMQKTFNKKMEEIFLISVAAVGQDPNL
jgi:hypothetical protein